MREKLIEVIGRVQDEGRDYSDCFIDGDKPIRIENDKLADYLIANGVTVQQWIPVTERLPEEHDSIFTSFHGTEKWQDGMFLKCSDTVLASVEYEDCKRRVKAIVTKDGKWDLSKLYRASKVTHWMPLPQPPKEG